MTGGPDGRSTPRHLDQRELAERWGLSPRTLERWRWAGRGPRYLKIGGKIGGAVRYPLEWIETYEAEHCRPSADDPASSTGELS